MAKGIVKNFTRTVETKMNKGDVVYINASDCSTNMINKLKEYISVGILLPHEKAVKDELEESKKCIDFDSVMSGKVILRRMTYIRS